MAVGNSGEVPPIRWILPTSIIMIGVIFTFLILASEIKNRRRLNETEIKFTTKSLQLSSICCMTCGFVALLSWSLYPFNIFCHFSILLADICIVLEIFFMGIYQLSRLYYCFANDQIHSKKGYPTYLFIIMWIIGIIIVFNWPLSLIFGNHWTTMKSQCGINPNTYIHYYQSAEKSLDIPHKNGFIWTFIVAFIFAIWDITTLLLYVHKINLFRHYKQQSLFCFVSLLL